MEIRPFHKLTSIMDTKKEWFVMRDLHRGHRAVLSYQDLANKGYETYTPTVKSLSKDKGGKTVVVERPYLPESIDRLCITALRKGTVITSAIVLAFVIFLVIQTKSSTIQPFIYFQF